MASTSQSAKRVEFGDFQTPPNLAADVCRLIAERFDKPAAVIEPTCGRGEFLHAALRAFPALQAATGVEINPEHLEAARSLVDRFVGGVACDLQLADFFTTDWRTLLDSHPDPLLVVGNPPWVTSAGVAAIGGGNLPAKRNAYGLEGLEAKTGKSNFDISEWMLIHLLEVLQGRNALLAMLCKTSVARKVLAVGWRRNLIGRSELRLIDAKKSFGANVDACLMLCESRPSSGDSRAQVFPSLHAPSATRSVALRDDRLISDANAFDSTRHLIGTGRRRWRSGIKHDCASVMELLRIGDHFENGLGEAVDVEEARLYPLLKSTALASATYLAPTRWILVTQDRVGDDTQRIRSDLPRTWAYLQRHADRFDRRQSSIYRGRPPFSIFGIGEYSFARSKVAVSALHKKLSFASVGCHEGKPVMLDDTCLFLPCSDDEEAQFIAWLLQSDAAQAFLGARIFWDSKRPITADVLNQLDLVALATDVAPDHFITRRWLAADSQALSGQKTLF